MLMVTFIPITSFGLEAGAHKISVSGSTIVEGDEGTYAQLEHGTLSGPDYDSEDGFIGAENAVVTLYIGTDPGYSVAEVTCVTESGDDVDVNYEGEGEYSLTMPGDNILVSVLFASDDTGGPETPDIDDCGSIDIPGWTSDDEQPGQWTLYDESNNKLAEASLRGGEGYSYEDGYLHALIGEQVSIMVLTEGDYKKVTSMKVNGNECWDASEDAGMFTVEPDDVDGDTRTPGNVITITIEDIFTEYSDDWEQDAHPIAVDQKVEVDTSNGNGIFKFEPEQSGKYVFYSEPLQAGGNDDIDPIGRVLDADGNQVAIHDDVDSSGANGGLHFQVYFEAEAGKVYYLQASDYDGTATFMVGLMDNDVESIELTPKKPYQLREGIDTCHEFESDIDCWNIPTFNRGDKLTITKKNGSSVIYERSEANEDGDFKFVNDKGEELVGWPEFETGDDWTVDAHPAGTQAEVNVTYAGTSTTATVQFVANPFTDLTVTPADGIHAEAINSIDSEGNESQMWAIVCTGTKFTFTTADGTVDYECDGYHLINKDTDDSLNFELEPFGGYYDDEGDYHEWEIGKSYTSTLSVAGIDKEVPVAVSNHKHTMKKVAEVPATCNREGVKEYWVCTTCDNMYLDEEGTHEADPANLDIPIDENAHHYVAVDGTGIDAGCKEEGREPDMKCEYCGDTKEGAVIPAGSGHDWAHKTVPAGQFKDGSSFDQCTKCGEKKNVTVIPGTAPSYVKGFKLSKGKKAITVKWKKQSKKKQKLFNGYQIRYSTASNMSGAKYVGAKKKAKSKKIKKLAKKTRYYVQIRTYTVKGGKTYYSGWSTKSVVTK